MALAVPNRCVDTTFFTRFQRWHSMALRRCHSLEGVENAEFTRACLFRKGWRVLLVHVDASTAAVSASSQVRRRASLLVLGLTHAPVSDAQSCGTLTCRRRLVYL